MLSPVGFYGSDIVEQFRTQGLKMLKRLAKHESLESHMCHCKVLEKLTLLKS